MEQLGLFNLEGGTIYDADEDIFIKLNKGIHGGDIGGKFRNPIEKAIKDIKKEDKLNKWLRTKGPAELAKYMEKFLFVVKVITRLGPELIEKGIIYKQNYNKAIELINSYKPVLNAYKKSGYESMGKEAVSKSIDYKPDKDIDPSKIDPLLVKGLTPLFKNSIEYKKEEPEYKYDNIIDYNDDDKYEGITIKEIEEIKNDPEIIVLTNKLKKLEDKMNELEVLKEDLENTSLKPRIADSEQKSIDKQLNMIIENIEQIENKKEIIEEQKNEIIEEKKRIVKNKRVAKPKTINTKISREAAISSLFKNPESPSRTISIESKKEDMPDSRSSDSNLNISDEINDIIRERSMINEQLRNMTKTLKLQKAQLEHATIRYETLGDHKIRGTTTRDINRVNYLLKAIKDAGGKPIDYVKDSAELIHKIRENEELQEILIKQRSRTYRDEEKLKGQLKGEGYVTSIEKLKSIEKVYNANFKKDRQAPMLRDRRQTKRDYSLLRRKDINESVSIEEKARNRTNYGNRKIIPSMYNRY